MWDDWVMAGLILLGWMVDKTRGDTCWMEMIGDPNELTVSFKILFLFYVISEESRNLE